MWHLDNRTPFACERCFTRDQTGAEVWLVGVKASFTINPVTGTSEVAEEQPPVMTEPEYTGTPGQSSLRYDNDLIPEKTGTDVVVNCHAYAPNNQPAPIVVTALSIGQLYKQLYVAGDRRWRHDDRGLAISPPAPFTKMPVVYERAFGGGSSDAIDPRNPVGTGFGTDLAQITKQAVPNVFYEYDDSANWTNEQRPAGFGAVSNHWQPRADYAGTMDAHYFQTVYPLLPEDIDVRYYRVVPRDQQCDTFLRGGEQVVLTNMTAQGRITFDLPRMRPGFISRFDDGAVHHRGQLHTVIIEPEDNRVSLVWHSRLPCHNKEDRLMQTLIFEKEFPLRSHD